MVIKYKDKYLDVLYKTHVKHSIWLLYRLFCVLGPKCAYHGIRFWHILRSTYSNWPNERTVPYSIWALFCIRGSACSLQGNSVPLNYRSWTKFYYKFVDGVYSQICYTIGRTDIFLKPLQFENVFTSYYCLFHQNIAFYSPDNGTNKKIKHLKRKFAIYHCR